MTDDSRPVSSYVPPASVRFPAEPTQEPALGVPTPVDAMKRLVDLLHPHVEAGHVTPEAALLSLATVVTRWVR